MLLEEIIVSPVTPGWDMNLRMDMIILWGLKCPGEPGSGIMNHTNTKTSGTTYTKRFWSGCGKLMGK